MIPEQVLPRILQEVNAAKDLDEVARILFRVLEGLLPYDRIGIAAVRRDRDAVELLAAASNGPVRMKPGYSEKFSGSSLQRVLSRKQPRLLNDLVGYLAAHPRSASTRLMVEEGMRASLTVPLIVRGEPFGMLFFSSRTPGAYAPEHIPLAENLAGFLAPVTEKALLLQELQQRTEMLNLVLEHSPVAIGWIDRDGTIRSWNRAAEKLFGYRAEEVIGRPYEQLCRLGEGEAQCRGKDGVVRDVVVSSQEIRLPGEVSAGRCVIWQDQTELRRLQAEVVNAQVLARVGELAAAVAHEVKNPLAGISGAIQVLRDSLAATDPRSRVIEEILRQIARLDRLIRDLLTFAAPWTPRPVRHDLSVLVQRLVDAFKRDGRAAGIEIVTDLEPGCTAWCDTELVGFAVSNVLANALEAVPPGGRVWVSCRRGGQTVAVEIADNGPGIPPHRMQDIFRPFFTTKAKGTGLGLSIVRRVMDAHHGIIRVMPRDGGGTRVVLEFSVRNGDAEG